MGPSSLDVLPELQKESHNTSHTTVHADNRLKPHSRLTTTFKKQWTLRKSISVF